MNKPGFTGKCVCGATLRAAYNSDLCIVFWNCFHCFPIHERATREQERRLVKEFKNVGHS